MAFSSGVVTRVVHVLAMLAVLVVLAPAHATTLDLTIAGATGTFNGATFTQGVTLSGTGRFPAFVQIGGNKDIVEAYNTTANPVLDNGNSPNFNHQILVSNVPIVNIGGTNYYS